jgi:hypothetical protein
MVTSLMSSSDKDEDGDGGSERGGRRRPRRSAARKPVTYVDGGALWLIMHPLLPLCTAVVSLDVLPMGTICELASQDVANLGMADPNPRAASHAWKAYYHPDSGISPPPALQSASKRTFAQCTYCA